MKGRSMWKVFEEITIDGSQKVTKVGDESGWPVALVFLPNNAPLVAAAPQLLSACYAALELIDHYTKDGSTLVNSLVLAHQRTIHEAIEAVNGPTRG